MSDLDRLQRMFDEAVRRAIARRKLPGELGRVPGKTDASNFVVPGRPGYTWVRLTSGSGVSLVPAINHQVAHKPDVPVFVELNERGIYEITGIRADDFLVFSGGAPLPSTSAAPATNAPVGARRIAPGLVHMASGMVVVIEPFYYRYGHEEHYFPGGSLDLTGYVPATSGHHAWCKVGVDPKTRSAVAVAGTSKIATLPLTEGDLAAIPFPYVPLAGVKLTNGMTAIGGETRFRDARPWWSVQPEPFGVRAATTLAIGGGAVTVTQTAHVLEAESGTADDLDTITAAASATFVLLKAAAGHTITVRHGADNISLNGAADFVLSGSKGLLLFYDGSAWNDLGAGGGSGSGTDPDAIHDNVAGEIAALSEKATPVNADLLIIEDSEASNAKKKVQVGNLPGGGGGVSGPASSTDNAIPRFDGTAGTLLQDSSVTIDDNNRLILPDDAAYPPLNVTARSVPPSSPVAGDVYLDDGTNTASGAPGWRRYTGAAWEDVSAASGSGGTDTDAIHDNVAGEIAALPEKATPVNADLLIIEDSEASNAKKKVQIGNLPGGGGGASSLDDLMDVDTSTTPPGDGQALLWDAAANLWLPHDVEKPSEVVLSGDLADTPGAIFSADRYYGSDTPDKAFDDDPGTPWQASGGWPYWLEVELPNKFVVKRYSLQFYDGAAAPSAWEFQYWNGLTWVTVDTQSGYPQSAEVRTFDIDNDAAAFRWRWRFTAGNGSTWIRVYEAELFADSGSGTDPDAIHDNVAGEIAALSEKATPVNADLLIIEDSEASNAKKKVQVGNLPGGGGGVSGPASSTDNAIPRFDGTAGTLLQDSSVTIDDNNRLILPDDAAYPPLNVTARSVPPSSPVAGDVYLDDGTNTASGAPGWRRYTGAAWEDVSAASGSGGTDTDAIHDNVAGEIAALPEKATPVNADLLIIEDSEASNAKKKVQIGNLPGGGGGASSLDDLMDVDTSTTPPGDGQALLWDAAANLWLPHDVEKPSEVVLSGDLADTPGAIFSADRYYGSDTPDKAFDDDPGTPWQASGGWPYWLEVELPNKFVVKRYSLQFYDGAAAPSAWEFQYWNGLTWVTVDTQSGYPQSAEVRTFDIDNDAAAFRWRWRFTAGNGSTWIRVYEAELFADVAAGNSLGSLSDVDTITAQPTGGQALVFDDTDDLWKPGTPDQWVAPPASASASGTPGQMAYDSDYLYVCVATDTWKRVALSTW